MILQRKLLPSWQLKALRRASRRLVFDFDDAVMFRDSYARRAAGKAGREPGGSRRTVCAADTVVAGNDFLADAALRAGASVERVHVIPTCVDPAVYPIVREEGPVELVWIGSSSTLQGLEQSRPIWQACGRGDSRPQASGDLRSLSGVVSAADHPGALGPADRGTRDCGGAHRHKLDSGRPLEPGEVWAQGLAVPGGRAAGSRQPGRCASRDDSGAVRRGSLQRRPESGPVRIARLVGDAIAAAEDGPAGPRQVESDYSVSAWADTFVTLGDRVFTACDRVVPGRSIEPGRVEGREGVRAASRPDQDSPGHSTRSAIDEPVHTAMHANDCDRAFGRCPLRAEPPSEDLVRRMFKPPDWQWRQTPDVGWWYRDGWGEVLLGPEGLRLDEWREAGVLTTVKSGPHRIVYCVRLAESDDLHQAFPGARTGGPYCGSGFAAARVETKASDRCTWRRSACRRSPRSRWASSGSGSSCSRITWSRRRFPDTIPLDEFVERRLPGVARAGAVDASGGSWPGRWR